jgi:hypothetical protein
MRRMMVTLVLAAMSVTAGGALPAGADALYHSQHISLTPIAGAPLRSGYVENIHPDGPNVYAHEEYVLNGAEPAAVYQVVLRIFPVDTTCSSTPIVIPTATIATNAAGNGAADQVFTPADAGGLRGLTVGIIWTLMSGSTPAYTTACATVHLD